MLQNQLTGKNNRKSTNENKKSMNMKTINMKGHSKNNATNTVICVYCGSNKVNQFIDGKRFKCRDCKKMFSYNVSTVVIDETHGKAKPKFENKSKNNETIIVRGMNNKANVEQQRFSESIIKTNLLDVLTFETKEQDITRKRITDFNNMAGLNKYYHNEQTCIEWFINLRWYMNGINKKQ